MTKGTGITELSGILEFWCLHIQPVDDDLRLQLRNDGPGYIPALVTGLIIEDFKGRWSPGICMRTSAVHSFNFQSGRVTTRNSEYALKGAGRIRQGMPTDYSAEVGLTMAEVTHLFDRLNAHPKTNC